MVSVLVFKFNDPSLNLTDEVSQKNLPIQFCWNKNENKKDQNLVNLNNVILSNFVKEIVHWLNTKVLSFQQFMFNWSTKVLLQQFLFKWACVGKTHLVA